MNTGEDIQGLRKILDFTRLLSLVILSIHFYSCCYQAFLLWGFTSGITDRIAANISKTGLFVGLWNAKLAALILLAISLLGVKGKKEENTVINKLIFLMLLGLLIYFSAIVVFYLAINHLIIAIAYMTLSLGGYLLVLSCGG